MSITKLSKETIEANNNKSALSFLSLNACWIGRWSDFRFTTSDGRTFGLFVGGDSIAGRLEAVGVAFHFFNPKRREEIRKEIGNVAGFILELGAEEPPFIFVSHGELIRAWVEFHERFGVQLSEDERALLDIPDEGDLPEGDEEFES